ncbi:MAG: tyrosinase family protein [Gemmatimonadota bacterium]
MYARKSASSLTAAEQNAFAAAVLVLKTRPSVLHPDDPDRGRYDDFAEVHRSAMAVMETSPPGQSWGHMAAAFAPWHRVLLHHFEAELQQIDPSEERHRSQVYRYQPGPRGGDAGRRGNASRMVTPAALRPGIPDR